jgi:hypothetical protein
MKMKHATTTAAGKVATHLLSLAGEYRVCSELNRRGIFTTVTYGNRKSVDVYVFGEGKRHVKVEVKTSQGGRFVTRLNQRGFLEPGARAGAPDCWVLVDLTTKGDRFFILTHSEIVEVQRNKYKDPQRIARWRHEGVDYLLIEDVLPDENRWEKVADLVKGSE